MKDYGLVIIDPENDFLASGNEPDEWPTPYGGKRAGALCVAGADKEAIIVANMIEQVEFGSITPTLDKHHPNDCAHNTSWRDQNGNSPAPFTIVSHEDIVNHIYVPRFAFGVWEGKVISAYDWALKYTKALADRGRNPLCLWPEHCIIDTWGSCIYYPIQEALNNWERRTGKWIDYVSKGQWPFTEHYSAIVADVPDGTRPETQMNVNTLKNVSRSKWIVWTGWAGSHCLKWTALDAVNYFEPDDDQKRQGKKNEFIAKSIFVEDACAPVGNVPGGPDFAQWRNDFLSEVSNRGARIEKAAALIKEMKAAV